MGKRKFSPPGLFAAIVLHGGLYFFATTNFFHHASPKSPYKFITVSLPVTTAIRPRADTMPDLTDLIVSEESLVNSSDNELPVDEDRYYLPQELSQQVHVLKDDTANLSIPIHHIVVMALCVNETGAVDEVKMEEKGELTDDEEDQLKIAFKKLIFLPGMRGERAVKALYRIQLEVNQKIIIIR